MSDTPAVGDRIQMTDLMPGDPDPIPVGAIGTVTELNYGADNRLIQIFVDWSPLSRTLILLPDDPFEIVG